MSGVGELFAGAAVGALFTLVYDAIKDVKDKTRMFRPLLEDLTSTLDCLKPLIIEIAKYNRQLDLPEKELEAFETQMKKGKELIPKCSKVSKLDLYHKYKYAKRLTDLDECLNRVFKILNVKGVKDGLKTQVTVNVIDKGVRVIDEEVKVIGEGIKRLQVSFAKFEKKENVVVQNPNGTQSWCAVPEPPLVTVGLDEPLRDLKKMLLEDDVSMLVLTAPGGCGKTTLATKFCQDTDVKDKFKNNSILFVTVAQKPNLDVVQELHQHMDSQAPTFQSEVIALTWLKEFLKEAGQNPLLLVLDDVWLRSKSLIQKFDELKMPNIKILVTSRSEFPGFGTPYNLKCLDDKDSMKLLRHSAALGDRSSDVPEDLLKEIVKHCKGFPLAITVTGKSLRGLATEFWRKRLSEWSKSSILDFETELLLRLQSSIDSLDEKEALIKECFIDLGSFPEDQRVSATAFIDMWAELYDLAEDFLSITNLLDLTTRGLANLVVTRKEKIEIMDDYYSEHFVTQHDLLRELAIYNTKLEPVEDRKRVIVDISGGNQPKWLTEQKSQPIKTRLLSISSDGVFSTNWQSIELPQVEVLVLNFQKKNSTPPGLELPEFVKKFDKLKVLIVTNYGFLRSELSNFQLLGSLSNLKRIRLEKISIPSITKNLVPLRSLKKISLFMCSIGQAFNNCSIKISEALPSLEEMNIDYCHDLVELPAELFDLIHLKKLSITNCHKLYALPDRIEKLINLEVLRLRCCTGLVKLPSSITELTKLKNLDISDCFSIKEFPEEIGEISSLMKLNMRQCSRLQELPVSVFDLEQKLEVICDEDTEMLWEPFLQSLRNISIKVAKENISLNWLY